MEKEIKIVKVYKGGKYQVRIISSGDIYLVRGYEYDPDNPLEYVPLDGFLAKNRTPDDEYDELKIPYGTNELGEAEKIARVRINKLVAREKRKNFLWIAGGVCLLLYIGYQWGLNSVK